MSRLPEWVQGLSAFRRKEYDALVRRHRRELYEFQHADAESWDRKEYHRRYAWVRSHYPDRVVTPALMQEAPPRARKEHGRAGKPLWNGLTDAEFSRRYAIVKPQLLALGLKNNTPEWFKERDRRILAM